VVGAVVGAVLRGELVVQGVAATVAQQILLVQMELLTRVAAAVAAVRITQLIILDMQAAQAAQELS
jgi:hypothetical protein